MFKVSKSNNNNNNKKKTNDNNNTRIRCQTYLKLTIQNTRATSGTSTIKISKGLLLIKRAVKYDHYKVTGIKKEISEKIKKLNLFISCGIHRGGNSLVWEQFICS